MSECLLSVGLDVGTTTTQLIVSELTIENRSSPFSVPEMDITQRKILYKSPVYFTPLLDESRVDWEKIREIVLREYKNAGISRETVDTGAIIITGETSRKENAGAVLQALSDFAGDFVVATAGPDLESVLAAKGAGAMELSESQENTVLHMDIGGGTSNLCLIREGKVLETGCLNVGGRLVKFDEKGIITYVSPVLEGLCSLKIGETAELPRLEEIAQLLTEALEMAAGLREVTPLLDRLWTKETKYLPSRGGGRVSTSQSAALTAPLKGEPLTLSFSGGVADCIRNDVFWQKYGDMGPVLGRAIRGSRLCKRAFHVGAEPIRATVIGAGCHSAQLSGSTVFHQNIPFPLKNLPVVGIADPAELPRELSRQEETPVIAMAGIPSPSYAQVAELAEALMAHARPPLLLCLEQDMAKALGQALALRLPEGTPLLCIDRIRIPEGSYLDIAAPVSHALPVVVKTLVLGN